MDLCKVDHQPEAALTSLVRKGRGFPFIVGKKWLGGVSIEYCLKSNAIICT
jgi:hypothetical protein